MSSIKLLLSLALGLAVSFVSGLIAQEPNSGARPALSQFEQPALRDLNSYFPFQTPNSIAQWEMRKSELRKNLLVALGMWPLPAKHDLNTVVHGRIEKPGYTIEKVYFESMPGFFVTGNLYKPTNIQGKVPGVLSPHGHFADGRFHKSTDAEIDREIESGAEQFRDNARSPLQARCANLARLGCIVFHYDMIGYADSKQISFELAHQFAKQRPELNRPEKWGLFSPQAESNLQSVMGMQTWNSIRALDFLCSLPDVDQQRLAVTGASGGGTQTFLLCAVDERPAVAFPAVMVSTAMQGGCTCENCCYLRVNTGNVELAAMFAPKPLAMTAADDWTKEMPTKGFPELQQLYRLYNKPENVQLTPRVEFGHNFNQVSREAMYAWFQQHLGLDGSAKETEIEFVESAELTVFDKQHPAPPQTIAGLSAEIAILRNMKTQSDQQLGQSLLQGEPTMEDFDSTVGTFVRSVESITSGENKTATKITETVDEATNWGVSLRRSQYQIPSCTLEVHELVPLESRASVLLIDSTGLDIVADNAPHRKYLVEQLLTHKYSVAAIKNNGVDSQSDHRQTRRVENPRESLAYTLGYNAPELANRALAWRSVLEQITDDQTTPLFVMALDETALQVAFNCMALRTRANVAGMVVDTRGFRFQNINEIRDPNLLPGAAKYFDLPGLLSLSAPKPLLVFGETKQSADVIQRAYRAAGKPSELTMVETGMETNDQSDRIIQWLDERLTK